MKAIILAAGRGSRLHPYTANSPKCLTELGGQTLIARQIATLRACGVRDISIVTGYKAEQLVLPGTNQILNSNWADTNMVSSLFCAADQFGDDLIVSYGDIIYEQRVLNTLLEVDDDIVIAVNVNWLDLWLCRFDDPLSDAETLRMTEDGRILEIGQKASSIEEIEAQYMGLIRLKGSGIALFKAAWAAMRDGCERTWMVGRSPNQAYMTDLLMELIAAGHAVHGVAIRGGWLEVDTVEDYKIYQAMFADGSIAQFYKAETES